MARIATLTLNPTIDVAYEVDAIEPTHKLRCRNEQYDPGGGGLNVARVVARLGGSATCYYLSGGTTGATLDKLLLNRAFERRPIPIAGDTRICFNVHESVSGREFRFVPQGPEVSESEWQICLSAIESLSCDYLVASGSLPRGVPQDFYRMVAEVAARRNIRLVLDTSGAALREGLAGGGIHLVKPSLEELSDLAGTDLVGIEAISAAARRIVAAGEAEMVAVTMGADGALFVTGAGARFLPAIPVEARSAVGAGDSFVAAMVQALSAGREPFDAFRYGMAAGSAAVLTVGTDMCQPEDVERLYRQSLVD